MNDLNFFTYTHSTVRPKYGMLSFRCTSPKVYARCHFHYICHFLVVSAFFVSAFFLFFFWMRKSLCAGFLSIFFVWLIIWQCNRLLLNASLFALLFASTSHMKLCRIPYEIKCYHVNVPCTMLMCVNQMKLCHVAQFRYFCKLFSQATRE